MIRVGVVGLGKMGLLHASILNALDGVAVVALCEKNPMVRRFARKLLRGVTVVGEVTELRGMGLDAVYMTTPPATHYPLVRALYERGVVRNVFVEKPLAETFEQATELSRMAREQGGVTMVGYHKRASVVFRKAREVLEQGEVGEVISFSAHAYSSDFWRPGKALPHAPVRGGVLKDLGCHAIDVLVWFLGDLEVEGAKVGPSGRTGGESTVSARLRTATGVVGELSACSTMEQYRLPEIGLHVEGTRGALRVTDDKVELRPQGGGSLTWHRHDLDDRVSFLLADSEYSREDQSFVQAIETGGPADPDFTAAARVNRVIDLVLEAAGRNE